MSGDRNSYGNILKAIGLFGGVKVFQILVNIVKNKFVALLLGPTGMGIVGMLTSTTSLISSFTGFGLGTSTVRDISASYSSGDSKQIGRTVAILRKLVWATGILGVLVTIALADYLSLWAFGNEDYSTAFRILSVILLFDQLTVGQTALMQGTFHYRYMAKASLYGSIIGLVISIPLYYKWGEDAIVPVIIITSLTALLLSIVYTRKIDIQKEKVTFHDVITDGRTMIVLGTVLAATTAFRLGGTYLQRAFISNFGSLADVGLYAAGSAIATQYIDVILGAMSTDYAPRLAAISHDVDSFIETINRQMKLMVTITIPFIVLFIIFARELIILLYSNEFLPIVVMIEWMMFSMFLRAISWCLSFSFVAKGESKAFFWNETACTIYSLAFSIGGYYFAGFIGLGLSFLITYVIYTVQMYILARAKFGFRFSKDCYVLIVRQALLLVASFIIIELIKPSIWRYVAGLIVLLVVTYASLKEFDKMIPIKDIIGGFKDRLFKKR